MCYLLFLLLLCGAACADGNPELQQSAALPSELREQFRQWQIQRDPRLHAALSETLSHAIDQLEEGITNPLGDLLARDGAGENLISTPEKCQTVVISHPVLLDGAVPGSDDDYPPRVVYRRLARHRIEAWNASEGWLFNEEGVLLNDVKVLDAMDTGANGMVLFFRMECGSPRTSGRMTRN